MIPMTAVSPAVSCALVGSASQVSTATSRFGTSSCQALGPPFALRLGHYGAFLAACIGPSDVQDKRTARAATGRYSHRLLVPMRYRARYRPPTEP